MKARLYQSSRSLPALISVGHVRVYRENRDLPEKPREKSNFSSSLSYLQHIIEIYSCARCCNTLQILARDILLQTLLHLKVPCLITVNQDDFLFGLPSKTLKCTRYLELIIRSPALISVERDSIANFRKR